MAKFERDENLKLGDRVQDRISKFTGVVVAITDWLNGCRRITIQPESLHDGKPVDSHTFDSEQVVVLESAPSVVASSKGGPSIEPVRSADPR